MNGVSRRSQLRPPSDQLLLAMLVIVLAIIVVRVNLVLCGDALLSGSMVLRVHPAPEASPSLALRAAARTVADFAATGRLRIAEVQPQRSVIPQHAAQLAEDLDQVRDIELRGRFEAERTAPGVAIHAERDDYFRDISPPVPAVRIAAPNLRRRSVTE